MFRQSTFWKRERERKENGGKNGEKRSNPSPVEGELVGRRRGLRGRRRGPSANARARRATGLGRWTGAGLDQKNEGRSWNCNMLGVAKSGLAAGRKGVASPRGGCKWIVGAKATETIVLSTLRPLLRSAGLMVNSGRGLWGRIVKNGSGRG